MRTQYPMVAVPNEYIPEMTEIRVVKGGAQLHNVAFVSENLFPMGGLPAITPEEARGNAELWAEASTVAHETGLTPRQLLDQRDQLLAASKKAHKALEAIMSLYGQDLEVLGWHLNGTTEPLDNFLDTRTEGDEIETLRLAIVKVEGK